MKVYDYRELKDSRVLYDKNPPIFMPIVIFCVSGLLFALLVISINFKKTYIVKGEGTIVSDKKQYVMCSVGGQTVDCRAKEGNKIKKDDVIVKIKSPELKTKKQELYEKLKLLQSREEKLRSLELAVGEGKNPFNKFDDVEMEFYNRFEEIVATLKEYDLDEESVKERLKVNEQVNEYLVTAKNKQDQMKKKYLSELSSEISKVNLEGRNCKIQIDAIDIEEDEFCVRSQIDGTVHILAPIDDGSVVQAGTAVATISSNQNLHVDAFISSVDRVKVKVGQDVKIAVAGFPKTEYGYIKGKIENIDSDATVDDKTGNVLFKISVRPETECLHSKTGESVSIVPGLVAEVDICYKESSYFDFFREKIGI